MLKRVLSDRGLAHVGFGLASLRAGGATRLYLSGLDLPRIQYRGRWLNERTVSIYIQEAVCALAVTVLPVEQREYLRLLVAEARFTLNPPPTPVLQWVSAGACAPP